MRRGRSRTLLYVLALLGAGNGLLLGHGLELCFGINRYLMIMLFGGLAGGGFALMYWLAVRPTASVSRARPWRLVAAGALPALTFFTIYFLWRVLPLVREEIQYYR